MWLKKDQLYRKKIARNVLKNPGGALEIGANVGTAFASRRSPSTTLSSLPDVINFYYTGEGSYFGKFDCFYTI